MSIVANVNKYYDERDQNIVVVTLWILPTIAAADWLTSDMFLLHVHNIVIIDVILLK